MAENKNAKTPADGPVAWACQCGKLYTVTCISSKPAKQEPVAWISDSPTKGNGKQLHWTKSEAWRWSSNITPLYTAPSKTEQELVANDLLRRAWETLETFRKANPQDWNYADDQLMKDLLRAEAKLREKNT